MKKFHVTSIFPKRYSLLFTLALTFVLFSTLVRAIFVIWALGNVDISFVKILKTFTLGFIFDVGTASFFAAPFALYLLFFPMKWYGSLLDRSIVWIFYSLGLVILLFSSFAEITFWDEFKSRFNFIAVDYLVYTYEVVHNINESYPIPILIGAILVFTFLLLFLTHRTGAFGRAFGGDSGFLEKLPATLLVLIIAAVFVLFVTNEDAERFNNRYNNEIAKNGIYSFFAAFRNNELSYPQFYKTLSRSSAFATVKRELQHRGDKLLFPERELIFRRVISPDSTREIKPNVIFICVESLSASFLGSFGNTEHITPNLDSLAAHSLFFINLYATGTRTVRGMEAIALSVPPTPGRSIVKRHNNEGLFTIGEIFKEKGYERNFFYGGDGYFDNMNSFFGGNGFNLIDRGHGFLREGDIENARTNITDGEVSFENAWGVADEDLYDKVIAQADKGNNSGRPFFDFVMTTSNHRPYTYPEGKIDIPSGTGRKGAVKYTDFAIGEFLRKAEKKSWFKQTVVVIMADHCASSAGRQDLDIKNYHIPALVLNLPNTQPRQVAQLASQIDIFPTLFSLFNWNYNSNLFGRDILQIKENEGRAFVGTYRKLGLLKGDLVVVLGDQKVSQLYQWNRQNNELLGLQNDKHLLEEGIADYQVADYLFSHGGLKLKTLRIQEK